VIRFSKRTGDYISLSKQDIELIALAIDIIKQNGNLKKIRKRPKKSKNMTGQQARKNNKNK